MQALATGKAKKFYLEESKAFMNRLYVNAMPARLTEAIRLKINLLFLQSLSVLASLLRFALMPRAVQVNIPMKYLSKRSLKKIGNRLILRAEAP